MGLFDGKVAGSGKGLPIDATITWNCEKKGFYYSSNNSWIEVKNIVAIAIRSDVYRIAGKQGNYEFKSEYGASGFVRGSKTRVKLYDGKTSIKDFGLIDWFKVKKDRDFVGSNRKTFILVKMLSYEIESNGSFRKNGPDDPSIVLIHSKYTGYKNIEKEVEALKLSLIAQGKGDIAEQISVYDLGGVGIKYMGKTSVYKSETYGKENTYPVPELVWLKDSKPEIFQEAMNQWHRFNDEFPKYWAGDFDDYVPAEPGETTPPPPPPTQSQTEIDDLPF